MVDRRQRCCFVFAVAKSCCSSYLTLLLTLFLNADSDLLTSGSSHPLRITVTLCPVFGPRPLS